MSAPVVVNEIYLSIQGESSWTGTPCIFIRLTGCDLRCSYCDTAYAFFEGQRQTMDAVLSRVQELAAPFREARHASAGAPLPLVEITGGEPLLQRTTPALAQALCDAGYITLIETNGARDISTLDPRVRRIVDLKTPSSGESERMDWENIQRLRPTDEVKFVIATQEDYQWAQRIMRDHDLSARCLVLFSWVETLHAAQRAPSLKPAPPAADRISRQALVERMIEDRVPARFQLQAHKFIWNPEERGV